MEDLKRNGSGYVDPTAYKAIKNVEKDKERRINRFIKSIHTLAHLAGLEIVGRIEIRDTESGEVWR